MSPLDTLPVVETFHSLQGEGHHCGRSAFFIRLAGCKVGCTWCDTKHSWPLENHPRRSIDALAQEAVEAARNGAAFTVITGGEPLHHDLSRLTDVLAEHGNETHLETSGVDRLSGSPDWITLSPKRHSPPRTELLQRCDELKVIVHEQDDLSFAEEMASETGPGTVLLLQPGWQSEDGQRLSIEHVRCQRRWKLGLQTHKWLGLR